MVAILYSDGTPINLTDQFSELRFDVEGFLIEFSLKENSINNVYRHYSRLEFKLADQTKSYLDSGFYKDTEFVKYFSGTGVNIPSLSDLLTKFKFDFTKYIANAKDPVSVNLTNFGAPFNFFYNRVNYSFFIENVEGTNTAKSYSEIIKSLGKPIGFKIKIPAEAKMTIVDAGTVQTNSPGFYFYGVNLGDFINTLNINDDAKRNLKKIASLIIFKIRYIVMEIFPVLLSNSDFTIEDVDAIANNPSGDITVDPNNALREILFLLKKSWGYYYIPNSTLPHRSTLPPMFNETSTYDDFVYYYYGLFKFYDTCHKESYALSTWPTYLKYFKLLEILSANSLSIIPLTILKDLILYFVSKPKTPEDEEQFIVKIVASIANLHADDFLAFLLQKTNCINTLFEIIYNRLDDARIERIPIAGWVANEQTNLMAFIYSVYQLWKHSQYCFYDASTSTIKPESYFKTNADQYYNNADGTLNPAVLEFGSLENSDEQTFLGVNWIDFKVNQVLDNEFVLITKYFYNVKRYKLGEKPDKSESFYSKATVPTYDNRMGSESLKYHLYQSIIIAGHHSDDRVALPNNMPIPAFLFFYTEDFERLMKIDAALALEVNIALEIVFFFTSGGIEVLKSLQFLKDVTLLRKALAGTLTADESVLIWAGLDAVSLPISVPASVIFSLGQYNEQILPTEAERQRRIDANMVFLYISLGFAGVSLLTRYKAVFYAEQALKNLDDISSLPNDIRLLLQSLTGQNLTALVNLETRLENLGDNTFIIYERYVNSYTTATKSAFLSDFGHLADSELSVWNALNKNNVLNNWEQLLARNIAERTEISIISNNSITAAYVMYFDDPALLPVLQNMTKAQRFKFFGDPDFIKVENYNFINSDAAKIELIKSFQSSKITGNNVLLKDDVLVVIKSELPSLQVQLITEKVQSLLIEVCNAFLKNRKFEAMSLSRLEDLFRGNFFLEVTDGMTAAAKLNFQNSNQLLSTIGVFNDAVPVTTIVQYFVSGRKKNIIGFWNRTTNLPHNFVDIENYELFKAFSLKAIDFKKRERFNDTEVKFVYNFLLEHWDKGNRFEITLESTRQVCKSCEGYLGYLKTLAAKHGKEINYKIITHPDAVATKDIKNLIK